MAKKKLDIPLMLKQLEYVLTEMPKAVADAFVEGLEGSARDVAAESVRSYRSNTSGPANSRAVESSASGRVRPTVNESFAGRPAQIPEENQAPDQTGEFSGIETARTFADDGSRIDISATEKDVGPGDSAVFMTNNKGKNVRRDELLIMSDEEAIEKYIIFNGSPPENADAARTTFLEYFDSKNKKSNSLLN